MKIFKSPIVISILIHIIVFASFMWIKIGNEYDTGEKVPVMLLEQKQNKLLKRLIPTRKTPSLEKSFKQYIPGTAVKLDIANYPSPLVYDDTKSQTYITGIESVEYNINPVIEMRRISAGISSRPIVTPLKQNTPKPTHMNLDASGGDKFVNNNPAILAKPKLQSAQSNSESLRRFLDTVRKRIEANKKYPFSAMNAGIEGRSGVRLTILMNGQLEDVVITDSSGNEVLDNSALESVRSAAPFPPIPSDVGRNKIEMSIYLVFKISQLGRM
jgi:TonB family protein